MENNELKLEFNLKDVGNDLALMESSVQEAMQSISDAFDKISKLSQSMESNLAKSISNLILNFTDLSSQCELFTDSMNNTKTVNEAASASFYDLCIKQIEATASQELVAQGAGFLSKIVESLEGKISLVTGATALWQGACAMLGGPFEVAITLVGLLGGALLMLTQSTEGTDAILKEHQVTIDEFSAAQDIRIRQAEQLRESNKNQLNADLSQIENAKSLKDELFSLVDVNGKVVDGNEERANFILSVLNDVMGTEYKIVDHVVQGYDKLSSSIDMSLEKMRTKAILSVQEKAWQEAIVNIEGAAKKVDEAEKILVSTQQDNNNKIEEILDERNKKVGMYGESYNDYRQDEIDKLEEQNNRVQEDYSKDLTNYLKYSNDKMLYEDNHILAQQGKYDEMKTQSDANIALEGDSKLEAYGQQYALLMEQKATHLEEKNFAEAEDDQARIDRLVAIGVSTAEIEGINNDRDLAIFDQFIGSKQEKLIGMYAIEEADRTNAQNKEMESLRASIDKNLNSYTNYTSDKISKSLELSSKLNENSTQSEIDAAASAEREALATLEILGKNATDKLDILADLKNKRAAGDTSITNAMIKEAERQALEAERGYGEVADKVNGSWDGMSKESRKAFEDVMKPMLEEMEKKEEPLFAKSKRIATGILDRLKKAFDINSPSRKVRKIFQSVMEGAEVGLDDGTPELMDQTEGIATNILDVFTTLNQSDIQALVHKMQSAMDSESMHMRGIVNSNFSQEMYATNKVKIEMPNLTGTIRGNIENHVMMDGRETAIQLSPFISEELAFTSR